MSDLMERYEREKIEKNLPKEKLTLKEIIDIANNCYRKAKGKEPLNNICNIKNKEVSMQKITDEQKKLFKIVILNIDVTSNRIEETRKIIIEKLWEIKNINKDTFTNMDNILDKVKLVQDTMREIESSLIENLNGKEIKIFDTIVDDKEMRVFQRIVQGKTRSIMIPINSPIALERIIKSMSDEEFYKMTMGMSTFSEKILKDLKETFVIATENPLEITLPDINQRVQL